MDERYSTFHEFERLLDKENSIVYHEVFQYDLDKLVGILLAVFGTLPLGFIGLELYPIMQNSMIVPIGLIVSCIGVIVFMRGFVLHRQLMRDYRYRGLSRNTISDAIIYIDSQLAMADEFNKDAPHSENIPYSIAEFARRRRQFIILIKSTAGAITWPSEVISLIEADVKNNRKGLPRLFVFLSAIIFVLTLVGYFMETSGEFYLAVLGLIPIYCILMFVYFPLRMYTSDPHMFREDWLPQVQKSESIQLGESLNEVFALLNSEYEYPLRFHLVKEYPQLKYTGRAKTSDTHVRLKEAVLYPRI